MRFEKVRSDLEMVELIIKRLEQSCKYLEPDDLTQKQMRELREKADEVEALLERSTLCFESF